MERLQNKHKSFGNSVYRSGNPHPFPRLTTSYGGMQSETTFINKEPHAIVGREKVAYFLAGFF